MLPYWHAKSIEKFLFHAQHEVFEATWRNNKILSLDVDSNAAEVKESRCHKVKRFFFFRTNVPSENISVAYGMRLRFVWKTNNENDKMNGVRRYHDSLVKNQPATKIEKFLLYFSLSPKPRVRNKRVDLLDAGLTLLQNIIMLITRNGARLLICCLVNWSIRSRFKTPLEQLKLIKMSLLSVEARHVRTLSFIELLTFFKHQNFPER